MINQLCPYCGKSQDLCQPYDDDSMYFCLGCKEVLHLCELEDDNDTHLFV